MPPPDGAESPRLGVETLVEALHLALAARALDRHGVFAALGDAPATAADLAAGTGLDAGVLMGTLAYLAARTELVAQTPDGFASGAAQDPASRFVLRLYADAFLPCSVALPRMLAGGVPGRIDEGARARAFAGAPVAASRTVAGIVHQLGFNRLLDLGCGSGTLLAMLAAARADFRGWGIDRSAPSCRAARARLHDVGAQGRVVIARGDVATPERAIPPGWIDEVETLFAGDLLNEFMADGGAAAVVFLSTLARLFPGRVLIVSDYYGRLGTEGAAGRPVLPMPLLHDFVQHVSGQGIPPPDADGWSRLYAPAGWRLVQSIDSTPRTLHLLTNAGTRSP